MTDAQVYAALILRYLRTGAYDGGPSTSLAKEAAAQAQGFARLRGQADVLAEDLTPLSHSTALQLLPDWEAAVGLSARGTTAQRVQAVLGRLRDQSTPTPAELVDALEGILGYAVTIHEVKRADLPTGRKDMVFQFVVELTGGWPDDRTLSRIRGKLDALKPAHASYHLTDEMAFVVAQGIIGRTII